MEWAYSFHFLSCTYVVITRPTFIDTVAVNSCSPGGYLLAEMLIGERNLMVIEVKMVSSFIPSQQIDGD